MYRIKLLLALLFISSSLYAQNITVNEPSMRVTRTASLLVTTSWQDLLYTGTADTVNYYGVDPKTGRKFVWYDNETGLFRFSGDYDKNVWVQLGFQSTVTAITTKTTFQYRLVIPNGISPGVDDYRPMAFAGGMADAFDATLLNAQSTNAVVSPLMVRVGDKIRANGFKVQVRVKNAITLGTCTLNAANAIISSSR